MKIVLALPVVRKMSKGVNSIYFVMLVTLYVVLLKLYGYITVVIQCFDYIAM